MQLRLVRDLFWIFAPAIVLTILAIALGWDMQLAKAIYSPGNEFASWARNYGQKPAVWLSVASLVILGLSLIPAARHKLRPLLRHAAVWAVTMAIGSGLVVNLILKEHGERPRPRDVVELGGQHEFRHPFTLPQGERGKSFPSGHATMGFVFAAFFFTLRRRYKKAALSFLALGLGYGALLGYARMVAGAHFFTDVVWSGAVMLAVAAIAAHYSEIKWRKSYMWGTPIVVALMGIGMALVLPIDRTIRTALPSANIHVNLPCAVTMLKKGTTNKAEAHITGFGVPREGLKLQLKDTTLTLAQSGIFHDIACHATVTVTDPAAVTGVTETTRK